MSQDILITPKSGEPQILFRGSGTTDTPIVLNVLSSYQSATGSGTAVVFEGTEGQLFGVSDNLSSGTIFSVSDITGLPSIEFLANGELKLGEFGSGVNIYNTNFGMTLAAHGGAATHIPAFVQDPASGVTRLGFRTAAQIRSDIGAGTGNGSVTSVATNNGLTGGTITTTGTLGLTGQALALHNLASNGVIARTGAGTVAARTITGTTNQVTVTNGDGVAGNPTLSLPQNIHTSATPTFGATTINGDLGIRAAATATTSTQIPVFIADPSATTRTIVTRTPAQLRTDINAPALNGGNLFTGTGSFRAFSIRTSDAGGLNWSWFAMGGTSDSAGNVWHIATKGTPDDIGFSGALHIRGNNGSQTSIVVNQDHSVRFRSSNIFVGATTNTGGTPIGTVTSIATNNGITGGTITTTGTVGLTGQALALHNLSTNGLIARTGTGTVAGRTITGTTNQVTVTNGDGVAGNPTLSLPQNIHTSAAPTFAGSTFNGLISLRASSTSSVSTHIPVFTADPSSTTRSLVTRLPSQLLSDIEAEYRLPTNSRRTNLGSPTVREAALFHGQFNNKFRFLTPTSQEESTDGVNWSTSTRATSDQLSDMMIGEGQGTSFNAIPGAATGTYGGYRLTWSVVGQTGYVFLNDLYVYCSTQGNSITAKIEALHNTNGWETIVNVSAFSTWPGHLYIPHSSIPYSNSASQYSQVRVTFESTQSNNTNSFQLYAIEWFGGYPQGRRNVESYDRNRNVTFPSAGTFNGALNFRASATGVAATQIPVFTADPASTTRLLVTRTPEQLRSDIGAQATLTNPVTGTGSNGQVSFWTGSTTQGGSSAFTWDDTNKFLILNPTGSVKTASLGRGIDGNFSFNSRQDQSSNSTGAIVGEIGLDYNDIRNTSVRFHRGSSTTGGFISFTTNNGAERARLDTNGYLGLGTTSPAAQLHVNASASTITGVIIRGAASQSADLQQWQNSSATALASVSAGGNLSLRAAATGVAATQIPVFTADPSSTTRVLVTRTPGQLLSDIGAQATLTNPVTGTGANGQISIWNGTTSQNGTSDFTFLSGVFSSRANSLFTIDGGGSFRIFDEEGERDIFVADNDDNRVLIYPNPIPGNNNGLSIGSSEGGNSSLSVVSSGSTSVSIVARFFGTQVQNIQEWTNHTNQVLASVNHSGNFSLRTPATGVAATQIPVFTADPSSTTRLLVTRTPSQLLSDIGAASSSHTHAISGVTGLQTELDGKLNFVNLTVSTDAATAAKTTVETVTFVDGFVYYIKFTLGNSVSNPTVNGVNIRLGTTNASTTTFTVGANAVVPMVYDAASDKLQLTGSYRTSDSVESYTIRWINSSVIAGETVTRYKLIMMGDDGRFYPLVTGDSTGANAKTVNTRGFVVNSPVLVNLSTTTFNENAAITATNLYQAVSMGTNFAYNQNQISGWTDHRPLYLVGTINSSGLFVLRDSGTTGTNYLTQTLPTTEDGFVYIYIGMMYTTTTSFRLISDKMIVEYREGALRPYTFNSVLSVPVTSASGILNSMVMSEATYNALGTKNANTLYFLT